VSDFRNIRIRLDVRLEASVEHVVTNVSDVFSQQFDFNSRSGLVFDLIVGSL
jgi:tetrahydromethanopterin S-methyltransferase subunit G